MTIPRMANFVIFFISVKYELTMVVWSKISKSKVRIYTNSKTY